MLGFFAIHDNQIQQRILDRHPDWREPFYQATDSAHYAPRRFPAQSAYDFSLWVNREHAGIWEETRAQLAREYILAQAPASCTIGELTEYIRNGRGPTLTQCLEDPALRDTTWRHAALALGQSYAIQVEFDPDPQSILDQITTRDRQMWEHQQTL